MRDGKHRTGILNFRLVGENDAALKNLQQSYEQADRALLVLACEPRLDPLRNTVPFRALAGNTGLHIVGARTLQQGLDRSAQKQLRSR